MQMDEHTHTHTRTHTQTHTHTQMANTPGSIQCLVLHLQIVKKLLETMTDTTYCTHA